MEVISLGVTAYGMLNQYSLLVITKKGSYSYMANIVKILLYLIISQEDSKTLQDIILYI